MHPENGTDESLGDDPVECSADRPLLELYQLLERNRGFAPLEFRMSCYADLVAGTPLSDGMRREGISHERG